LKICGVLAFSAEILVEAPFLDFTFFVTVQSEILATSANQSRRQPLNTANHGTAAVPNRLLNRL
jgi:hypothetical protein